ncbi:endonuclease [Gilliamella sp. wkB112]|uniref:endonuclease n=1 Tax=Gilliamella sp. wkB112 TaxID=3120257 RepID=UPI003FA5FBEE
MLARKFQPREQICGTIAYTYIYMSDKYKINLLESERDLMHMWDSMYKLSVWECGRNELLTEIQGNNNKFVTERCR